MPRGPASIKTNTDRIKLSLHLPREVVKIAKHGAVEAECNLQDYVADAIRAHAKNGARR